MGWRIEFLEHAKKDLAKLDKPIARRVTAFLRERVAPLDDPRALGQPLRGARLGELWKYRVADFRIIVRFEDDQFRVLVVKIGHRREVYRP